MPVISETVTIDANIEAVFDLISRIQEFPSYAEVFKEVREIGPNTYRWTAQAAGVTLTWDSVITEYERPTRIAWRSINGFANSGAYALTLTPNGTEVSINIEYGFPGTLSALMVTPLVRAYAAQILHRVKQRLEAANPSSGFD
jgi:uncharacterized membrane protein